MIARRWLLALTGLEIPGGIASVGRTIARVLDEEIAAGRVERADRVLLYDDERSPAPPARGVQWRARARQPLFAAELWLARVALRPDLLLFDLVGLARSLALPGPTPPYAVLCHGIELERIEPGSAHERALLGAARLVANSQTTARFVRERFPAVAARVRAAPLCIEPRLTDRWSEQRAAAAREGATGAAERAHDAPVVLIIGRVWSEERGKGHDELIEAWPRVRAAIRDAELWVVGDGDDRPRLEEKVRAAGLGDAVRFFGRVSDDELARCYERASLFAMPSRQEGFGLVYAEAMWHGLPCLASTRDAGAEVVRDGETGVLVPYGDVAAIGAAIAGLLGDAERLARMGRAAFAEARERFGYARFRRDLLAALDLGDER
ncbi:MAG: glycosyltransferase family 4 protein [Myxococcales bacterium]|nr:glycosyltransferase family 4 protein [Myxococcales bacterium]